MKDMVTATKDVTIVGNKYLIKGKVMKKAIFKQIQLMASIGFNAFHLGSESFTPVGFVINSQGTGSERKYFIYEDNITARLYKFLIDDPRFTTNYPQIFIV
jgi:hypothetical protein